MRNGAKPKQRKITHLNITLLYKSFIYFLVAGTIQFQITVFFDTDSLQLIQDIFNLRKIKHNWYKGYIKIQQAPTGHGSNSSPSKGMRLTICMGIWLIRALLPLWQCHKDDWVSLTKNQYNKHCEILVSCSDKDRNCIQAHETAS